MDIGELSDRTEIQDLLYRYARGVDSKDWALWRSVFVQDAELDYRAVRGPLGTRDDIENWLSTSFEQVEGAHHYITNIEITVTGDRAEAIALFYNPFRVSWAETFSAAGGYYRHSLKRTSDGWRSYRLVEDNRWIQNPPSAPPSRVLSS